MKEVDEKTNVILETMHQQQQIETHGWQMFKDAYEREHPKPILEKQAKHTKDWIYKTMLVGLFGAMSVGALQTIPAFYIVLIEANFYWPIAAFGGFCGFLAIDLTMFSTAHFLIQTQWRLRSDDANRTNSIENNIKIALGFGFIVSVASNFYFVFFAYDVNTYLTNAETPVTLTIAVLIALAPAIQSLSIGAVIAALPITQEIENLQIEKRNREIEAAYLKAMRSSWDRRKTKYGVQDINERIARLQDESVHENRENFMKFHETPKKRTATRERVHEYLNIHGLSKVIELSEILNLSIGLISEERRNWINENKGE